MTVRRSYLGVNNPNWKGGKDKIICKVCRALFEQYKSQTSGFCSKSCGLISKTERMEGKKYPLRSISMRGKDNPNWKGGSVKKCCEVCEKEFEVIIAIDKIGKGKFCSRKCMGQWQTEIRTGENSGNWKGGVSELGHSIRSSIRYKNWRKSIFKRDDYVCVMGGKTHGNRLVADHIKPFTLIIRDNKIKFAQQAMKCKELWDIENGRTLCEDCHRQTDTYGIQSISLMNNKKYAAIRT